MQIAGEKRTENRKKVFELMMSSSLQSERAREVLDRTGVETHTARYSLITFLEGEKQCRGKSVSLAWAFHLLL